MSSKKNHRRTPKHRRSRHRPSDRVCNSDKQLFEDIERNKRKRADRKQLKEDQ